MHANGYEVDSFVPGGDRLKLSGTSMAAPKVTNLAAKLFAVNPDFTVAQVKSLILDSAAQRSRQPHQSAGSARERAGRLSRSLLLVVPANAGTQRLSPSRRLPPR